MPSAIGIALSQFWDLCIGSLEAQNIGPLFGFDTIDITSIAYTPSAGNAGMTYSLITGGAPISIHSTIASGSGTIDDLQDARTLTAWFRMAIYDPFPNITTPGRGHTTPAQIAEFLYLFRTALISDVCLVNPTTYSVFGNIGFIPDQFSSPYTGFQLDIYASLFPTLNPVIISTDPTDITVTDNNVAFFFDPSGCVGYFSGYPTPVPTTSVPAVLEGAAVPFWQSILQSFNNGLYDSSVITALNLTADSMAKWAGTDILASEHSSRPYFYSKGYRISLPAPTATIDDACNRLALALGAVKKRQTLVTFKGWLMNLSSNYIVRET
jgi:hypothetical protein